MIRKIKKFYYTFNDQSISFIFILLILIFHLLYINTPFVNYEWAYRAGTQSIVKTDYNLLKLFFYNQANPISYSFLSCLPLLLFGDYYATYRIFSLIGCSLLLISLLSHRKPFLIVIV